MELVRCTQAVSRLWPAANQCTLGLCRSLPDHLHCRKLSNLLDQYFGELTALVTAFLWAASSLLFTLGSLRVGVTTVNLTRLAYAFVFISAFHLVQLGTLFPYETDGWRWGVLAVSSILGLVIGDGALFYAFVRIGPQLSMLVMTLVPVLSAFFAWVCFGEPIYSIEFLGIGITVLAIGWVVTERRQEPAADRPYAAPPRDDTARNFALGVGLAFVGVLGQTANLVLTKYALADNYSELSATSVRLLVALVWLIVWTAGRSQLAATLRSCSDWRAVTYTAAGAFVGPFLGIWFSYIAIQATRIGVAATLMATPPLILIPLCALFLNERVTLRAILGTTFAIVGVAILFSTLR